MKNKVISIILFFTLMSCDLGEKKSVKSLETDVKVVTSNDNNDENSKTTSPDINKSGDKTPEKDVVQNSPSPTSPTPVSSLSPDLSQVKSLVENSLSSDSLKNLPKLPVENFDKDNLVTNKNEVKKIDEFVLGLIYLNGNLVKLPETIKGGIYRIIFDTNADVSNYCYEFEYSEGKANKYIFSFELASFEISSKLSGKGTKKFCPPANNFSKDINFFLNGSAIINNFRIIKNVN